ILVSIRRRGERLRIAVADTGTGMSADKLAELNLRLRQPFDSVSAKTSGDNLVSASGIGLANVANRLTILYGQEAVMRIYSVPGKGTIVRLSLPLKGIARWPESL
ncbi:MAG: ATP-binding protein, partial [Spirochaetia bacterium]|nr:ATP-binding protein [Spirochaetia bacterium]